MSTSTGSLGDIFGVGNNDAGPKADPSKRFYESKTGFWTTLYHDTKGRTDVVAKKATSSVFRLTDLGLDQKFALTDLGKSGNDMADEASQSGSMSSIWGGAPKDVGAAAKDAPPVSKPAGIAAVGGFRGFLTKASQDAFLSFTREGSAEDAHAWWIENRKELTDGFRRKHRDALRGKRNNRR
jgi:hypothetical protein